VRSNEETKQHIKEVHTMKKAMLCVMVICILCIPIAVQARRFARWHTSMGSFTAELYDEIVPITANNFTLLTNNGFYNNKIFHRVIQGFVIQDGCPYGNGYGGPGWTIVDEISPLLDHNRAGMLAMAKTSAPNSAGSQYYFTLAPRPTLNGNYAVFGKIIDGLENVLAIGGVPVDSSDRPITPVTIHQLRMLDLHISSLYPEPAEEISCNPGDFLTFMVEAYTNTAQLSFEWRVNDVIQEGQTDMIFEPQITQFGLNTISCNVASSDSISHSITWQVNAGTSSNSEPSLTMPAMAINCYPNPFSSGLDIELNLEKAANVELDIFNIKGQLVRKLKHDTTKQGVSVVRWDATDANSKACPSGIYLVRLKSGNKVLVSRNHLIRN